ncbi:PREDICTED: lipase 1-like [Nicrophorus vespilloides]|uniref:Lipase n=1 Tax=Nicrophorus vespilloides TaxID=110193 RepID=A0ABM1MED5_NICVS|nr:PREDICTED: lipase 1-like [Nicrophorus vespilloides]
MFPLRLTVLLLYSCYTHLHPHAILGAPLTVRDISDELHKTTNQIITKYGYPCETHYITTEDGYILTVYRIPKRNPQPEGVKPQLPVLLVHGLFGSSADWVLLGPENALSFLLSDNNYDVWLINCRGTRYSMNHTTLDPESKPTMRRFWNYSWHEIGVYDIPATIDYILPLTQSKQIIHVGHSQGATSFAVMMSEKPEYNEKVIVHIAYAPAIFLCNIRNPLLKLPALSERTRLYTKLRALLGDFNAGPQLYLLAEIGKIICQVGSSLHAVCKNIVSSLFDMSMGQILPNLLPILLGHYPAGASTKQLVHYSQSIIHCDFRKYQEGPESSSKYNLSHIRVPIYAYSGNLDTIQVTKDTVKYGKKLIGGFRKLYVIRNFAHSDFVFGKDAKRLVYNSTINILNSL